MPELAVGNRHLRLAKMRLVLGMRRISNFHILGICLISLISGTPAFADELNVCDHDRIRFCGDKKDLSDIRSCLIGHDNEISIECKQELERFLQARKQAMSRGGGALSSFGGLNAFGPPVPLVSYEGRYSPGAPSFTENKLSISAPVHKSETSTLSLALAGSSFHLGNSLTLDSGRKVPVDLYRTETGAQYFDQLPEKKNWGLRGSIGYAGDKPFANSRDLTYSLSANYGFSDSGRGIWLISIFFSNNSPLGNYIPIPGVSYLYKTNTFTGLFGFPIASMQWTPVFPWVFSLAIFGPTVQSEAGYGSIDRVQAYSGFYWMRQSYIPSDRDNDKERLTSEEKKMAIGLRTPILAGAIGDVQFGEAFDRSIYIGDHLLKKDGGSVPIPSGWYVAASLKVKF